MKVDGNRCLTTAIHQTYISFLVSLRFGTKLKFEFEELEGEINFYANELGLELDNMDGM